MREALKGLQATMYVNWRLGYEERRTESQDVAPSAFSLGTYKNPGTETEVHTQRQSPHGVLVHLGKTGRVPDPEQVRAKMVTPSGVTWKA